MEFFQVGDRWDQRWTGGIKERVQLGDVARLPI